MTTEHFSKPNPGGTSPYPNERVGEYVNSQALVQGSPETIFQMTRGYFESAEWSKRDDGRVEEPLFKQKANLATFTVDKITGKGFLIWLGLCAIAGILMVITGEAIYLGFAIALGMWWGVWGRRAYFPKLIVTAYPVGDGFSKVTVSCKEKPEHATRVVSWLRARQHTPRRRPPFSPLSDSASSTSIENDIPERIRQLAKLHYEETITQEEFESKKKDLLSRM